MLCSIATAEPMPPASERRQRFFKVAVAGESALVAQAESLGRGAGLLLKLGIICLGKIQGALVVSEIGIAQLREPVEAEGADQECLEMASEEIGDEKRRHHPVAGSLERLIADIEGEAVRPFDPFDAMGGADLVEFAARAAIGIADEDVLKAFLAGLADGAVDSGRDAVGMVMEIGVDAFEVDMVVAELPIYRQNLAADHAAGDDADLFLGLAG